MTSISSSFESEGRNSVKDNICNPSGGHRHWENTYLDLLACDSRVRTSTFEYRCKSIVRGSSFWDFHCFSSIPKVKAVIVSRKSSRMDLTLKQIANISPQVWSPNSRFAPTSWCMVPVTRPAGISGTQPRGRGTCDSDACYKAGPRLHAQMSQAPPPGICLGATTRGAIPHITHSIR